MKLTKEEFMKLASSLAAELSEEAAQETSSPTIGMALMLYGMKLSLGISKRLFENENEIEIVKDKE